MASTITLSPQANSGYSASGFSAFKIYGNKSAAVAATGKYYWTKFSIRSPTGTTIIPYPGTRSVDAKFQGGNTNRFTISGYVIGTGDAESTLIDNVKELLSCNKGNATWKVEIGSNVVSSSLHAVIMDIICGEIGEGTGPRWPFTMEFVCLGNS